MWTFCDQAETKAKTLPIAALLGFPIVFALVSHWLAVPRLAAKVVAAGPGVV